jgi:hypothetical protein
VSIVPVFLGLGVGEAHGVVHAAANQLAGLVHHHLVHLVGVTLPLKAVILSSFRIPIMCKVLKNINDDAAPNESLALYRAINSYFIQNILRRCLINKSAFSAPMAKVYIRMVSRG